MMTRRMGSGLLAGVGRARPAFHRRTASWRLWWAVPALLLAAPAFGQTAGMLSFQGLIKDAGGVPVSGAVTLQFRIFDAQTLGSLVDMDGDGVVEPVVGQDVKEVMITATNGVVSTKFGPVFPSAFDGTPRWLEVSIAGSPLSRIEMATAPATAEQLNLPGSGASAVTIDPSSGRAFFAQGATFQGIVQVADGTIAIANSIGTSSVEIASSFNGGQAQIGLLPGPNQGSFIDFGLRGNPIDEDFVLRMSLNPGRVCTFDFRPTPGAPAKNGLTVNAFGISTPMLTISGGADLAEPFAVTASKDENQGTRPGIVVVIDPDNPGQLRLATEPYDGKVAGIISGANGLKPGMVMKAVGASLVDPSLVLGAQKVNPGDDNPIPVGSASDRSSTGGDANATVEHPVALTGRVWCWCDATYGPIQPGDRLTTSATPGHAMKVTDSARAPGAVIGKAMTPLSKGRGLVLVLVQPQ